MTEEKKEEEHIEQTTFYDRVEKVKEDSRKKFIARRPASQRKIAQLNDEQIQIAKAIIALMEMNEFKTYIKIFEATETANALRNAFEPSRYLKKEDHSFGELMAFNKGFYYGLLHSKQQREALLAHYLTMKKQQEENEDGNNQNNQ